MAGGQAIEGAKRSVLFQVDPESVELQGIDYSSGPEDPCYNPRNKESVDEALVESIMRLGVLEPIGVVKSGDKIRALFGNQRVRAARQANYILAALGKPTILIPCLTPLRGFSDDELSEAALAENEIRRATGALARSELASIHLKRKGGDMSEAAKAFGMRIDQFKALINLKEAVPEIKAAVKAGKIGTTAAIEIASLPKEDQPKRLEEVMSSGGTIWAAKETVKKAKGQLTTTKPGRGLIKSVAKAMDDGKTLRGEDGAWDAGFVDALAWVLGKITANDIEGMPELIEEVTA